MQPLCPGKPLTVQWLLCFPDRWGSTFLLLSFQALWWSWFHLHLYLSLSSFSLWEGSRLRLLLSQHSAPQFSTCQCCKGDSAAVQLTLSKRFTGSPLPKLYVFQFISPCFLCMWCVWFYTSVWDLPAPYLSPKVPPLNAANHQLIFTQLISSSRHTPPLFYFLFPLATMPVANAGFLPPEYSLAELSLRCANISN